MHRLLRLLLPLTTIGSLCTAGIPFQGRLPVVLAQNQQLDAEVATQLFEAGEETYNQGDYQTALEHWQAALAVYRQQADTHGEAKTLNYLGKVYTFCGECGTRDQALEYLEESLAIAEANHYGSLQGENLLDIGFLQATQNDHEGALAYYQLALERFEAIEDLGGQGDVYITMGGAHETLGQFDLALQYYEQALAIHRDIGNRISEASALNNMGFLFARQGQQELALAYYQQALIIRQEIGNRAKAGETLNNIGGIYEQLNQYDQALDYFLQALDIHQEVGNLAAAASTLTSIGLIYSRQGNYQAALPFLEGALDTYKQQGAENCQAVGEIMTKISDAHAFLGNYSKAFAALEQALSIHQQAGSRSCEASTLGALGLLNSRLGRHQDALEFHQQALEIQTEINDLQGQGNTLTMMAGAYLNLGNVTEASRFFTQSLDLHRATGNQSAEAATLAHLGYLNAVQEEYAQALDYYQQSLTMRRALGDLSGVADVLAGIGGIYHSQYDYTQASSYYHQALIIQKSLGNVAATAAIYEHLGFLQESLGQPELAILCFKGAINAYEQIRTANSSLELNLQNAYTSSVEDTYRHLADLLLQQDRILEAQRVLDLLKVQELDTYLKGVRTSTNSQAGIELVPPETVIASAHDELIDRAIANGKRFEELISKGDLTVAEEEEMVALQEEQTQILQAFNEFKDSQLVQDQLALLSPEERDRNVSLERLVALQDNLAEVPQGAVLLYPFILDNTLELVVTSPYAPPIHRTVAISRQELNEAVRAFRYALEEPTRNAIAPAQKLYSWLIAPIEADLNAAEVNTIVYAPDRTLRYIPLAALHDGEQWLAERYRINNITAASLTDFNAPPRSRPRILAGALTEGPVTVTAGNRSFQFSLLEYADDEVQEIAELAPGSMSLLDEDFNRQTIEREASRHNILHLATHAQFLVGESEDSFILFSNQERWTLAEIKQGLLNLPRVDLVVLSACETAVDNTFGDGEEILGFGYLMEDAGVRASMASLWAVNDGGTRLLMTEFYDGLIRGGLSKAEALQQAQLALIHMGEDSERGSLVPILASGDLIIDPTDLSHPHYWAPFILIGNGL